MVYFEHTITSYLKLWSVNVPVVEFKLIECNNGFYHCHLPSHFLQQRNTIRNQLWTSAASKTTTQPFPITDIVILNSDDNK